MVPIGVLAVLVTVAVTLGTASLVGSMATRLAMFPLLTVAQQGACYLSGVLIFWTLMNWAIAGVLHVAGKVAF